MSQWCQFVLKRIIVDCIMSQWINSVSGDHIVNLYHVTVDQ